MIQLLEKKTGVRLLVFALLLTILAWLVPVNIRTAHAGETSAPVEKSHSQNYSQSKGKKDIQAANKALPTKSLSKSDEGKRIGKAKAASNSFDIHIAGEYQQAKAYEMLRYANQNRDYEHKLQWDSELEEAAMIRAAELPIYYSVDTRPNGQEYNTTFIAFGYDYVYELYQALYQRDLAQSPNMQRFNNYDYTHFAAAAFKADNDILYWVVLFNTEPWSDTNPINQNYKDNNVYVNVMDRYLKWQDYLMDAKYENYWYKDLQKGKKYYLWIDVYNYAKECENLDPILLQSQYSSSSNKGVLTIDQWGTIRTKSLGVSTVKVAPNQDSSRKKSWNCVVRPGKVAGLKVKAKNKAITVSWKKMSGASGYQVCCGKNKSCTNGKKVKNVSSGTSSVTIKGLEKGTTYYAKVRAYKASNGKKYYGDYCALKSAKTKGTKTGPLYKQCAGSAYYSKYKSGASYLAIKFGKASKGKIKTTVEYGSYNSGDVNYTKPITATVKGKTIKIKAKRWYSYGEGPTLGSWSDPKSMTITLVNSTTIKVKITSGKRDKYHKVLNPGKTITLKHENTLPWD